MAVNWCHRLGSLNNTFGNFLLDREGNGFCECRLRSTIFRLDANRLVSRNRHSLRPTATLVFFQAQTRNVALIRLVSSRRIKLIVRLNSLVILSSIQIDNFDSRKIDRIPVRMGPFWFDAF